MPRARITFEPPAQAPSLRVERALTVEHQAHGLMFRPALGDEEGMLFTFADTAPRSFWMRNTCLALDMLFLDEDGRVVSALEQVPPWNDVHRESGCPARHVLEVPAGWVRRHGVQPGQQARIDALP
jgi:hypothetical protein